MVYSSPSLTWELGSISWKGGNRTRHTARSVTCPGRGTPVLVEVVRHPWPGVPQPWLWVPQSWPGGGGTWARSGVCSGKDLGPETWERTWDWISPQERTWDQRPGKEPGTRLPPPPGVDWQTGNLCFFCLALSTSPISPPPQPQIFTDTHYKYCPTTLTNHKPEAEYTDQSRQL